MLSLFRKECWRLVWLW